MGGRGPGVFVNARLCWELLVAVARRQGPKEDSQG